MALVGHPASYLRRISPAKRSGFASVGLTKRKRPGRATHSTVATDPERLGRPSVSNAEHAPSPEQGKGLPVGRELDRAQRLRVLAALVEGNSERATERMSDVGRQAIGRFAMMIGEGAVHFHDRMVRDLTCNLIQVDEIWSYVQKKQARVTEADAPGVGEAYTYVALDASSRMVIAYHVGKRDQESTDAFMTDVRARLLVMPQMTSDGYAPYISSIGASFGPGIDYAQTIKNYTKGGRREDYRYEPPRDPFITKKAIYGAPNMASASTAYVERNNGTMRHHIGRIRRLCLAFSKKVENHKAAVALNYAWYNFGLVVRTLRVTPAMAAGVTDHIWSLEEFMDVLLAEVPAEKPEAQPLRHRIPVETARELPAGRGFLRVVQGGKSPVVPPSPAPSPPSTPVAVPPVVVPAALDVPPVADDRQLDLLAWKPKPRKLGQLSLFGGLSDGEE